MNAEAVSESGWARRRTAISLKIEISALELCLQRGAENVTVEQIAVASGMSRRTFYRYFETIDDILIAQPQRMLLRSMEAFRARPAEESIREAFLRASENIERSEQEWRLIELGAQIARKSPTVWWRAMGRMQPSANDLYAEVIADRLRASGRDPAPAAAVAAAVLAIVGEAGARQRHMAEGEAEGMTPEQLRQWAMPQAWLDDAIRTVGEILCEGG
jgi:AcrR family transcriptional regulator